MPDAQSRSGPAQMKSDPMFVCGYFASGCSCGQRESSPGNVEPEDSGNKGNTPVKSDEHWET